MSNFVDSNSHKGNFHQALVSELGKLKSSCFSFNGFVGYVWAVGFHVLRGSEISKKILKGCLGQRFHQP